MNKELIKDIMYGGLNEIVQNRKYYYDGFMDEKYSKFTEEGQAAVLEYIKMIAHKIIQCENDQLKARAKELVLDGLKGDNIKL